MLSDNEKELFGKVAWIIYKKGHLPIDAILKFIRDCSKDDVKKFIKLVYWLNIEQTLLN